MNNPVPPPLQKLLSKHDDFLTEELAKVREAPGNQADAQGDHTELFITLMAALSKVKGVNFMQAADTVTDFLSRKAPDIRVPRNLDAGPQQMKRMLEKMTMYVVEGTDPAASEKKWWQFWK
jgi:hypothetical protein